MMGLFSGVFWGSLGVLIYIFIGYPLLLMILSAAMPAKTVKKRPIRPRAALIVSCYNEEAVIREKLENSLALEYPKGMLEIYVVSDASSDATDDIVREYAGQVTLLRQEERWGKTAGLNRAVQAVESEILIFSDANAMYRKDAIIKLVESFADETVGYVVGHARYSDGFTSASAINENAYWSYEGFIKKRESRLHSVVGGDGAIYAIRRELYTPLLATDINDFVNPLQIISQGYRGIYEPDAICIEETAGSFRKEITRKKRIVTRSMMGLLRVRCVLNPFVSGLFSWQVFSHKLLRWLTPVFFYAFIASGMVLGGVVGGYYRGVSLGVSLFLILASVGYLLSNKRQNPLIASLPYYFMAMNGASFLAIIEAMRGRVPAIWSTPREKERVEVLKINRALFLIFGTLLFFWYILGQSLGMAHFVELSLFWLMVGLIVYGYIGYPLVLSLLAKRFPQGVAQKEITPRVALLICAFNEEAVIEEKILNSLGIDYPRDRLTIIIASDGSTDKTNEIVEKYAAHEPRLLFYPYPERRGKIGTINRTVPKIEDEIIVFSDANTMMMEGAMKKLVRKFYDPSVGGVSADVILVNNETHFGEGESTYYQYERWIQKNESLTGSIVGADGGMYAIRRELFGAPSSNVILDDLVISMNVVRKGYRLVYEAAALAYEVNVNSSQSEFLRRSRVVAGGVQVLKQREGVPGKGQKTMLFKYLSHKVLRWILPVCLVTIFLLNSRIVAMVDTPIYDLSLALQVLFYLLALMGPLLAGTMKSKIFEIPYYFCLSNSAALYGLYKGLFDKQSVKWRKLSRR